MTTTAPETLSLAGKVAVVTGAGREPGIGAGIATALARNGAAVVVNFKSDDTRSKAAAPASSPCRRTSSPPRAPRSSWTRPSRRSRPITSIS